MKNAKESFEAMVGLLEKCPKVAGFLQESESPIRESLQGKMDALGISGFDGITGNFYHEDLGVGLCSFNLQTKVLAPQEWKNATVGIIHPSLIPEKDSELAVVKFQIEKGKAEIVRTISPGGAPFATNGALQILPQESTLKIDGPAAAHTMVRMLPGKENAQFVVENLQEISKELASAMRAIYFCDFVED